MIERGLHVRHRLCPREHCKGSFLSTVTGELVCSLCGRGLTRPRVASHAESEDTVQNERAYKGLDLIANRRIEASLPEDAL